jgi:hypothetical protein
VHADGVLVVGPQRHHRVDVGALERLVERFSAASAEANSGFCAWTSNGGARVGEV